MDMMPPETRCREEDKAVILAHQSELAAIGEDLVQAFYNTLFAHPQTAAVFHEGERPMREDTLRNFWKKTVEGPLDDDYFAWMAMVGLVHVVRNVENPMIIAMSEFMANFVRDHIKNDGLGDAFDRLSQTTSAVVVYGFDQAKADALREIIGMEPALLLRLAQQEAVNMLARARENR